MRNEARVVIIGAGIVGSSAAYYLSQKGWREIVVIEQGPLFEAGGSTSHAPGGVFQTNASKAMCLLSQWSVQLYSQLQLNDQPCFYPVGTMEIAYTPERREELKRKLGHALAWGLEAYLVGPEEIGRKVPIMDTTRIYSAFYVPSDGIAKAVRACEALANISKQHGVTYYGDTTVTGIEVADHRVRGVVTSHGRIRTETVLVCAGIWGPRVGQMAGVPIPLTPCQHLYARTAPLPELAGETREVVHPVLRHQDKSMYFRQHADCYGIGSYLHEPLMVDANDIRAHGDGPLMPSLMPFPEEHFARGHAAALELFPCFRGISLPYKISGMFSFTPDSFPLIGESDLVRGFWVAEAIWITHGGGAGKVVAEWMAEGVPSIDLREMDLNRFHSHALSPSYIRARGTQQYREIYDIIHPLQQIERPRNLRLTPFHPRLKTLGAIFFENVGWERPQWFAANEKVLTEGIGPERSGWAARYWSPIIGAEHVAARERVALFDLTPFAKIEVSGPKALEFLQYLTTNQLDQPIGKVTYTSMLNELGGIMCDLTVTRLEPSRFLVVTGGAVGMHDLAWIRTHLPADGSVQVRDITSAYCCLGVWGPRARDLLTVTSENDFSNQAFPYMTAQPVNSGHVPAYAVRISYAGELGWELYAPTEYGLALWDTLWDAGQPLGIIAAGGGAFDSMRLEKGYRLWGADIHSEYNPYEAGLGFSVKLNKGEFLGREALGKIRQQDVTRKLCCMTFDDPNVAVMGKEPIFDNNRLLGYVTSANYGYCMRESIVYGYLPIEYAKEGTKVEVYYFGDRHQATVNREPLYDPLNVKVKS
jgi:glycine cleavage system aminomethyltransferase T/glycine/D-amino acid oxidase-like deaminating enzyme